jgi:hypothetical protein
VLRGAGSGRPKEWSYLDWFQNIRAAVRSEYGDQLILSPDTQWSGIPCELQKEIERSAESPAV